MGAFSADANLRHVHRGHACDPSAATANCEKLSLTLSAQRITLAPALGRVRARSGTFPTCRLWQRQLLKWQQFVFSCVRSIQRVLTGFHEKSPCKTPIDYGRLARHPRMCALQGAHG